MKIGVMIRSIDTLDGPGVYTENLLDAILSIDTTNSYILFYKTPNKFGRYSSHPNVKEILIKSSSIFLWDQVYIPFVAYKENVDVIFHTKFSVPLLSRRPTVMVLRGSEWFVHPEFYSRSDILYQKLFLRLYCKSASKLISISENVRRDFHRYLGIPLEKMTTIYNAVNSGFRPLPQSGWVRSIKLKYGLPDCFILTVSRAYPGKNNENMVRAFCNVKARLPHKLVIVGQGIQAYILNNMGRQFASDPDILFTGAVPHSDLPAFYNLADFFLFPTFYEGCPIPPIEAMACGCPTITGNVGGSPEIVGDMGILVNPLDVKEIECAMLRIGTERNLREELSERCLDRARHFSWERVANETITILESAVTS